MGRMMTVVAVVMLALLVVQVVADETVIVVNPQGGAGGAQTIVVGEGGQPGATYTYKVPVDVAPVPTPPGVIGEYNQLPCAPTGYTRAGGPNLEYFVNELCE